MRSSTFLGLAVRFSGVFAGYVYGTAISVNVFSVMHGQHGGGGLEPPRAGIGFVAGMRRYDVVCNLNG